MTDQNIIAAAAATEAKIENRGRKHRFGEEIDNKKAIAAALLAHSAGMVSTFHLKQLATQGYVEHVKLEKTKEGRGRRPMAFQLTDKGRKLASIARNIWKMEVPAVAEQNEEMQQEAAA